MSRQELVTKLRDVRFLQNVEEEYLAEIAGLSTLRSFEEGEVVFREGEPAEHVYFCVSGVVALEMCAPGSGCRKVLTLGPGEMIGWSSILDHSWLTATARTTSPTVLIKTHARQLGALCRHNSELGMELMRRTSLALAKRLSAARLQLLDLYGNAQPNGSEASVGGQQDAS